MTEIDETTALPPEASDAVTRLLIRARGFLERGWCRWAQARSATGRHVRPDSRRAVEWCAYGALVAAGLPNHAYEDHPAVCRLIAAIGDDRVAHFNNRQESVEPVLAAFDRAIAMGGH
jgi:hypothetical protein